MYTDEKEIENDGPEPLYVILEPWAFEFKIEPGKACRLKADSHIKGEIEILKTDVGVEVFGWQGSNLSAQVDGDAIFDADDLRCPGVGISPKDFVHLVFRKRT